MTRPTPEEEATRAGRVAAIALSAPPIALAAAAVIGLGTARSVPVPVAIAVGFALAALPVLGLRFLLGASVPRRVFAGWAWSLALLVCLPFYFPGERHTAADAGLRVLFAPLGEAAAGRVAAAGAALAGGLGRDPTPLPAVPAGAQAARRTEAEGTDVPGFAGHALADGWDAREREPAPESVVIPYEGDERSLRIAVDIDGPTTGEQFKMLFDTGATFSTLDARTLERVGVRVPADAPVVTLRTANGEIEAPLVLVDAVWLGGAATEWVTVAVCDSCATPESSGLLGLNVSRRFRVALDHDRRRIELHPRRQSDDRSLDITPWISLRSEAMRYWDGAVELELTATSRATQEIDRTIVDVSCSGKAFAVQLDGIPALGTATTRVSLPRGTDCSQQRLDLSAAYWRLDRF